MIHKPDIRALLKFCAYATLVNVHLPAVSERTRAEQKLNVMTECAWVNNSESASLESKACSAVSGAAIVEPVRSHYPRT